MIGPRKVDRPLVLYGYGNLGHLAEEIFVELGIPVHCILDQNKPYIIPDSWKKRALVAICVASEPYSKVIAPLVAEGWTDIVPVWDVIEAYPEVGLGNGWFVSYLQEENEWIKISKSWKDRQSQIHYAAFCQWRMFRSENTDDELVIEPIESLPSTLADIRRRQGPWWDGDDQNVVIHAEGCELQALKNGMPIFKQHRPKLTVACYHSHDGLWKIPKFLMDNLEDYTFTFRCHAFMGQAAYIYCTPKERG